MAGAGRRVAHRVVVEGAVAVIDLTVITVTIPERAQMLTELAAAIEAQTMRPTWLIEVDEVGTGPVPQLNHLAQQVETEWLFRLDDDDLVDPDHFAALAPELEGEAYDVVYTWPRIVPATDNFPENGLQLVRPLASLEEQNFIASAVAIRASVYRALGGVRDVAEEDADLLVRAYRAGARFRCIPEVTWTYRLGDWPHRSDKEVQ